MSNCPHDGIQRLSSFHQGLQLNHLQASNKTAKEKVILINKRIIKQTNVKQGSCCTSRHSVPEVYCVIKVAKFLKPNCKKIHRLKPPKGKRREIQAVKACV